MAILELIDVSKSFGEKKVLNHLPLPSRKRRSLGLLEKMVQGKRQR